MLSRLNYIAKSCKYIILTYSLFVVGIPILLDIFYILLMFYYIEILNYVMELYGILMLSFMFTVDIMISCFTGAFLKKYMLFTYNIHIFCF